jgi:CPA1 family monovalent cation:H+ antiporter
MVPFEHALLLLLVTAGLSILARWLPWPRPITYAAGGVAFALVPSFPKVTLEPGFFFLCFLPPLLFSDGWLMPLREFAKFKRSITLLSIGLVLFTTATVGLAAHALIPGLPLAMAFALGAVISPTDAVSVSSITERLKVPSRLRTILTGESLMNDATGLVAFKAALAAVAVGTFSFKTAALQFAALAVGGSAVGLIAGYGVGRLRDLLRRARSSDAFIEVTLSLLTPFAAYLVAEALGLSSVLAVVVAGLYSGWRDPLRMDVESRQTTWTVWSVILFWLNGLAFVLLGLQFPHLLAKVRDDASIGHLVWYVAAVSGVAMAARIAWFFPGAYLPFVLSERVRRTEQRPSWQAVFVGGWAGMRGVVTLAAALSIPLIQPDGFAFPDRDLVIFISFGVIATTLLVQGTTLEWLICKLKLQEDPTRQQEEHLARTTAVEAGLAVLRGLESGTEAAEESAALGHVVAEYEHRLASLGAAGETRTLARRRRAAEKRFRSAALDAERAAIDDLWRRNIIADEVHRPLQQLLDYEESMLRSAPSPESGEPRPGTD